MAFINKKVLAQLFEPTEVLSQAFVDNYENEGSDESGDECDDEVRGDPHYKHYLSDLIAKQYEEVLSQGEENNFKPESLKKELSDELLDIIETEYFAGTLYELLHGTFMSTIQYYLEDELLKNPG